MNQNRSSLLTPRRAAIALSIILGVFHVILLGWTLQRRAAIEQLAGNQAALEVNLSQLEEINQEQLDALEQELASIEGEIVLLEESFPDLGASFDLYRRGLDIAQASGLELISIGQLSSDLQETAFGSVLIRQYTLDALGGTDQCLALIAALEDAGAGSLTMDAVSILPADYQCLLDLSTIGYPPAGP